MLTAQAGKVECLAHLQLCRTSRQRGEGAAGAAAGLWAPSAQRLLISNAMDTRPVTRPRCGRMRPMLAQQPRTMAQPSQRPEASPLVFPPSSEVQHARDDFCLELWLCLQRV